VKANVLLADLFSTENMFAYTFKVGKVSVRRVTSRVLSDVRTLTTWHYPHSHAALPCVVQQSISCRPGHGSLLWPMLGQTDRQIDGRPTDA